MQVTAPRAEASQDTFTQHCYIYSLLPDLDCLTFLKDAAASAAAACVVLAQCYVQVLSIGK